MAKSTTEAKTTVTHDRLAEVRADGDLMVDSWIKE